MIQYKIITNQKSKQFLPVVKNSMFPLYTYSFSIRVYFFAGYTEIMEQFCLRVGDLFRTHRNVFPSAFYFRIHFSFFVVSLLEYYLVSTLKIPDILY